MIGGNVHAQLAGWPRRDRQSKGLDFINEINRSVRGWRLQKVGISENTCCKQRTESIILQKNTEEGIVIHGY